MLALSRPQIRSCAPELTAALRLRAEPPVGREVSCSSWHSLIEQSGFVSVDSCSDGGRLWLAGGGWLGDWIWEAEEGEAKARGICKGVEVQGSWGFHSGEPPRKLNPSDGCQDMGPNRRVTAREEECAWRRWEGLGLAPGLCT